MGVKEFYEDDFLVKVESIDYVKVIICDFKVNMFGI